MKGAFALNLLGINVTVPYKSDVIPYLDDIDPLASNIGAVNTLVRTEKGYKGYNTDMPGLYRAMCEDGVKVKGQKVLILGAGGVARAVAMMLLDKGGERGHYPEPYGGKGTEHSGRGESPHRKKTEICKSPVYRCV